MAIGKEIIENHTEVDHLEFLQPTAINHQIFVANFSPVHHVPMPEKNKHKGSVRILTKTIFFEW